MSTGGLKGSLQKKANAAAVDMGFENQAAFDLYVVVKKQGLNGRVDWVLKQMCNMLQREQRRKKRKR